MYFTKFVKGGRDSLSPVVYKAFDTKEERAVYLSTAKKEGYAATVSKADVRDFFGLVRGASVVVDASGTISLCADYCYPNRLLWKNTRWGR